MRAIAVDGVDIVVAGGGGPGHEERAVQAEGQMIGGDAGLQRGKDKDLPVPRNLEDGAAAVAHVKIALGIEGDPGGDSHALGVNRGGALRE